MPDVTGLGKNDMRILVPEICDAIRRGVTVALYRLTRSTGLGSTGRGAAMLVFADGRQVGSLGDEWDEWMRRRPSSTPIEFTLGSAEGNGWSADYLVWPLQPDDLSYFRALRSLQQVGKGGTEAIWWGERDSPACYLFDRECQLIGRKGAANDFALQNVRPLLESGTGRVLARDDWIVVPIESRRRLIIVGGGPVGLAVARIVADLEFEVILVDPRSELANQERFPMARRCVAGDLEATLPSLEIDEHTCCLMVTRDPEWDRQALSMLMNRGACYVGMIGSQEKIRSILQSLREAGTPLDQLRQVRAPVGLKIGSQSVPEIAVSIAAELIAVRRGVDVSASVSRSLADGLL